VFRRVYAWTVADFDTTHAFIRLNSLTESAYELLCSVGGVRGLLRALEGFRDDHGGRIPIGQLPQVYLIALDLALADRLNAVSAVKSMHDQAAHAAAIAAEAEALDRLDSDVG
jgi:hypothetical protein